LIPASSALDGIESGLKVAGHTGEDIMTLRNIVIRWSKA
jgi:hypothetical protein